MLSRRSGPLTLALLGALFGAGCIFDVSVDDDDDNVPNTNFEVSETFSETVAAEARTRVRVTAINGSIELRSDPDATMVEVTGERIVASSSTSDAASHLDDLRVTVTSSASEVFVETRQPTSSHGRRYEVRYLIVVPDDFEALVSQVNGAVDVWGPLDDIDIDGVNGTVSAVDIVDGAEIDLVNGEVSIDVLELNSDLELSAVNGTVEATLPTNSSAEVFADLANGTIRVVGLTLTNQVVTPRSLRGTLGDGLYTVDLETVNGDLELRGR